MTWKSTAVLSGATVLATYFASAPPVVSPRFRAADQRQPGNAQSIAREAPVDIEREAARLQTRLREEPVFREPSRNPFRFGPRDARVNRAPRAEGVTPQTVAPSADAAPAQPFIVLSGMAADVVDGSIRRTAILTTSNGVLLVGVGDNVGPEYRVKSIEEDSVELESLADGTVRRLRFAASN